MSSRFTEPENIQFSPFSTAVMFSFFVYAGLVLLLIQAAITIPWWIWLLGIPTVLIGYTLEVSTNRILWIRIFQVGIGVLIVIPNLVFLWLYLASGEGLSTQFITLAMLICMVVGTTILMYRTMLRLVNLCLMPHGPRGLLNARTGVVDPKRAPKHIEIQQDESESILHQIGQLSPLIAGIAMFLIQVLSKPSVMLMLSMIALLGVCLALMLVVGSGRYILSIASWEKENGKPIRIAR